MPYLYDNNVWSVDDPCGFIFIYCSFLSFLALLCPLGEQSDLPNDDEDDVFGIFDVETPDDTEPEDVLAGSGEEIPIGSSERIVITVPDAPDGFVVMDIKFNSDVPITVVMFTTEGVLVPAQDEPVSP